MDQTPPMDAIGVLLQFILKIIMSDFFSTVIAGGIGAVIGTSAGVWFGFRLNKKWEITKEVEKDLTSGRSAQYCLLRQYESLINLNKSFVEDIRVNPTKMMINELTHHKDYQKLEIGQIYWMFTKGGSEILHEMDVQNSKFWTFIESVNELDLLARYLQTNYPNGDFHPLYIGKYQILAKSMLDSYDIAFKNALEIFYKYREYLKKLFPDERFLKIKDEEV